MALKRANIHLLRLLLASVMLPMLIHGHCFNQNAFSIGKTSAVFDVFYDVSLQLCSEYCARNGNCKAINYNRERLLCELTSSTSLVPTTDAWITTSNFLSVQYRLGSCTTVTIPLYKVCVSLSSGAHVLVYNHYVRIVNGTSPSQGRLEVYRGGEWGTVCNDDWNDTGASVVCRSLGYGSGTALTAPGQYYSKGDLEIVMDQVQCKGTEEMITECPNNGWKVHNCGHHEDVGVICFK